MKIVEFKPFSDTDGKVTGYLHTPVYEMDVHRDRYPVLVLCPGGAYRFVSERESDPVAIEFFAAGYNVFTLVYSCLDKACDLLPLRELSAAVIKIREKSTDWYCDPDRIAVCGFSAGGHLAASLATMWNEKELLDVFDTKNGMNRPNAVILGYPVILANEYAHEESIRYVSGSAPGSDKYRFFSLDKHVSSETCPVFIWHTAEDDTVPCENTIYFAAALQKNKIPYECHIFPSGSHGLSVCTNETGSPKPHVRQWVNLAINWLNELFSYDL